MWASSSPARIAPELKNNIDPAKGAALIGQSVQHVASKTVAAVIEPVDSRCLYIAGSDGGLFYAKTGAAPGTYASNGGVYCGTVIANGDGSAAWVRQYEKGVYAKWWGGRTASEIQAAIDEAQRIAGNSVSGFTCPDVVLESEDYTVDQQITWKTCSIVSNNPTVGTRIKWNGLDDPGYPVFVKSSAYAGGSSHGKLIGVEFLAADAVTARPTSWLECQSLVDKQFQLDRVRFCDTASDAILLSDGWINLHWGDLRFDRLGGWAINAVVRVGQNLSSWKIDRFTYDNVNGTGNSEGCILIDNTVADAGDVGVVEICAGRIEINQAWKAGGRRAVVSYKLSNTPSAVRSMGLIIGSVTYADATGMADDCLLDRWTSNSTGRESLIISGFRSSTISAILGGTWPADQWHPVPESKSLCLLNWRANNEYFDADAAVFPQVVVSDITVEKYSDGVLQVTATGAPTGKVQATPAVTTADLESVTATVNTAGKFGGKFVINTTTGRMVYASSGAAAAAWKYPDGTTAHTPV